MRDITDIFALALMALFVMRRMEIRAAQAEAFPRVSPSEFAAWQSMAVRAWSVAVNACFLKVFLNVVWYYAFRHHAGFPWLRVGGLVIYLGWITGLISSVWLSFRARSAADRLGIVIGRRLAGPPKADDERPSPPNS